MRKYAGLIVALVATLLLMAIVVTPSVIEAARNSTVEKKPSKATSYTVAGQGNTVTVGQSVQNDTSPPLRDMKQLKVEKKAEKEANENPKIPATRKHKDSPDAAVQGSSFTSQLATSMPATSLNFDGVPFPGVGCNCAPPDTNGEVGATQYVQIVNEGYQVFDKTSGASLLGPSGIATLWSGFGAVSQNNGSGDPAVLYDQLPDRWVIGRSAGLSVPTDECIAVSTTSDATGSYFRYGYHLGT